MKIGVEQADTSRRPTVIKLLQSYLRELAEFAEIPNPAENHIEYPWQDLYWTCDHRIPYIISADHETAGFAFVRSPDEGEQTDWAWQMAEFYVAPEFRHQEIGTEAAALILAENPGLWEISFSITNSRARRLWQSVAITADPAARLSPAGTGRYRFLINSGN